MEVLPRLLDLNTQQRLVSERCSPVEVLSNSRTDDRALRGCRCGEPENDPFLAAAHVFRSTTANPPRPSLALRLSPLLGSFHPSQRSPSILGYPSPLKASVSVRMPSLNALRKANPDMRVVRTVQNLGLRLVRSLF